MPNRHLQFRPALLPTLGAAVLLALFVHLGQWQAGKAERKAAQQAVFDQRLHDAPLQLTGALPADVDMRFRRVAVRGEFDAGRTILLDNRIHRGRAGFHVITPLRIEGSNERVLVNRGWVPFSGDRRRLPEVSTPAGPVQLAGHAVLPPAAVGAPVPGEPPGVWPRLDMARAGAEFGPLLPLVVQLDPEAPAGYVREWERPDERIDMHRGYALQWFALATTLALAWVWLSLRRAPPPGARP